MNAELLSSAANVKRHWTNGAIFTALIATIALAAGIAAFAIGSIDLRITMVVAVVTGIAATVAANTASQDTARGAVWLGVWLALAFLIGGAVQGLWNATALIVPLLDMAVAAALILVYLKFATIVSRCE